MLTRLSEWLAAVDERAMERTRAKIRSGSEKPPDGKIGPAGVLIWTAMTIWPAVSLVKAGRWVVLAELVVFVASFAVTMSRPPTGRNRTLRYVLLVPVVVLGLLLVAQAGDSGQFLVIFPSMTVAMVLPLAFPAFAGVLLVTGLSMLVGSRDWGDATSIFFSGFFSGFVMFVLRRLFTTIGLLRQARVELARAAVAEERLRFSRDLHDLLGHTLSVIVVKAEVVRRLVDRDSDRAAEAAADIETIGRQALVEVREAVTGYRERGLMDELDGARGALVDAGIEPTVRRRIVGAELGPRADALLGWAVREGTTNVIRHSHATACTISLEHNGSAATLRIADDGRGSDNGVGDGVGNGLRGLTERFAEVGGTVRVESAPGGFTLTATVPTTADDVERSAVGKMC